MDDFCERITAYYDEQMQGLKDFSLTPTNIEWLDKILNELFAINSFNYDDISLYEMLKACSYSHYQPYQCLIISFGNIIEQQSSISKGSVSCKTIQVNYNGKRGLKRISDLIYPMKDISGITISAHIVLPWSWHDTQIRLNNENVDTLLVNKQYLLLYSIPANNKFNKEIRLWSLVALKDKR